MIPSQPEYPALGKIGRCDMLKRVNGFGLIEVLIALIVLGVGLLGVALFSGQMLSESGNSKARSEALMLAQGHLELIREASASLSLASLETDALLTASQAIGGRNAEFVLTPQGTVASSALLANVTVNWTDANSVVQSVSLNTQITDASVVATETAAGGGDNGAGNNPFALNLPTGGAQYGSAVVDNGGALPSEVRIDDLQVIDDGSGGVKLVYDSNADGDSDPDTVTDSDELLTYSGDAFSEIRGIVYVDSSTGLDLDDINVFASLNVTPSDTGVCPKSDPFTEGSDFFFEYRCFFGADWYGRIDVQYVIDGNGQNPDEIDSSKVQCVGDPTYSDDGTDLSNHAQAITALDDKREYRGYGISYLTAGSDSGVIGSESGDIMLITQGIAEGDVYGYGIGEAGQTPVSGATATNHDFYLSNTSSGCAGQLSAVSVSPYQGTLPGTTTGNNGAFSGFASNHADFVCLMVNGVQSCPADLPSSIGAEVSAAVYSVAGTVSSAHGSASTSLVSVTNQFPTGSFNQCVRGDDGSISCSSNSVCRYPSSSTYQCLFWVSSGSAASWEIDFSISDTASAAGYSVCEPSSGTYIVGSLNSSASGATVVIDEIDNCSSGGGGGGGTGGPGGASCDVVLTGTVIDKQDTLTATQSGSCIINNNNTGYSCSWSSISDGTSITVVDTTEEGSGKEKTDVPYPHDFVVDCPANGPFNTSYDFPGPVT